MNDETPEKAWDKVLELPQVRSVASFFVAARFHSTPADEVIVISTSPQAPPGPGGKLRLELRRSRNCQLGSTTAQERVASDAAFMKKKDENLDTYSLAIDGLGVSQTKMRYMPLVSQKGAPRSIEQLCELLNKPGREDLKAMYNDDVVEFSVLVGNEEGSLDSAAAALIFD